jgi:hypothetical protein
LQHTNGLLYGETAVGGVGNAGEGTFYSFNIGLGPGPVASLNPSALAFAGQPIGTTCAAQIVTLTNSGGKPLNLTQIAASGDFSETNDCNMSLAKSSCQISVIFKPTAIGSQTGAVTITDNALGNRQMVPLSGVGIAPDFSIGTAAGSPTSQTISAGRSTTFNLAITPASGFSGPVNLTCSISPTVTPAPACSLPSSVNVMSGTTAPVTVTLSTTAPMTTGTISTDGFPWGAMPLVWAALLLGLGWLLLRTRERQPVLVASLLVLVFASWVGCSGVSSSASRTAPGTPAGT